MLTFVQDPGGPAFSTTNINNALADSNIGQYLASVLDGIASAEQQAREAAKERSSRKIRDVRFF